METAKNNNFDSERNQKHLALFHFEILRNDIDNFQLQCCPTMHTNLETSSRTMEYMMNQALDIFARHAFEGSTPEFNHVSNYSFLLDTIPDYYLLELDVIRTSQEGFFYMETYCYTPYSFLVAKSSCTFESELYLHE